MTEFTWKLGVLKGLRAKNIIRARIAFEYHFDDETRIDDDSNGNSKLVTGSVRREKIN